MNPTNNPDLEVQPNRQFVSETKIPIVEEEVRIDKQVVESAKVRISKHVREVEQTVDVPLVHEEINVQRVPVNQLVQAPPPPIRYEGDTMIISVLQETLVVEKRLLLVEELHVTKRQVQTNAPQQVSLLKEELEVVRTATNANTTANAAASGSHTPEN